MKRAPSSRAHRCSGDRGICFKVRPMRQTTSSAEARPSCWIRGITSRHCVVVGADRIAANGDSANKIGTFGVAILAQHFGIPFYIAAPLSTIDPATPTGTEIPIEERPYDEVATLNNLRICPEDVPAYNFAFDVTPAHLITGIITEQGVLRQPYKESIAAAFAKANSR